MAKTKTKTKTKRKTKQFWTTAGGFLRPLAKLTKRQAALVSLPVVAVGALVLAHAHAAPLIPAIPLGLYETNTPQNDILGSTKPTYAVQYYNWNYDLNVTDLQQTINKNMTPFVELQPCTDSDAQHNCDVQVKASDITGHAYDTYLNNVGNELASLNHKVLVTYAHEMNGYWYPWGDHWKGGGTPWTATQWINTWQYVAAKIQAKAPNAKFVWVPNREDCVNQDPCSGGGIPGFDKYWPGKVNVDYIGLDAYLDTGNTWKANIQPSVTDEINLAPNKPWMLAETGVNNADSNYISQIDDLVGGTQNVFTDNQFAVGLVYFNPTGSKWHLTTSGAPSGQHEFCIQFFGSGC